MRTLELLSPAKTADIGIEAIRHGADAVYIGAKAYGARAAAGNSVEDIARLVDFAHQYRARVYVTVNTLIRDEELPDVERLIHQLWDIHVDALIIQDPKILTLNLPPIPLHASTQMDNRTVEKVQQLAALGFPQVVLARELTTEQIAAIHAACPDTVLEVFVHGALCVSLSGRCNASEVLFGRSANRGECAQVCRMKFELTNPLLSTQGGKTHSEGRHYLSLKDNCQLGNLERLLKAGATSFKIEGRLKDLDYVKNVTAAYSQALDAIIARYPDRYCRRSSGRVTYTFTPDVRKSFNRGFVADVSKPDANLSTPKAIGEPIGKVREVFTTHFTLMGNTSLHNGDGLCYLHRGELIGFRINKVEEAHGAKGGAARIVPLDMPRTLTRGTMLFRNQDTAFDRLLSRPSADRRIAVDVALFDDHATMTDEDGFTVTINIDFAKELARTHQYENLLRQFSRLGDTIFSMCKFDVSFTKNWFIPSSLLTLWRRTLVQKLMEERAAYYPQEEIPHAGSELLTSSFSLPSSEDSPLMITHYCLRRQLGICLREGGKPQPLSLRLANGTVFRLEFDCRNCLMTVWKNSKMLTKL